MSSLSQLSYLPENKEQLNSFVLAAKNEILSGNDDILDVIKKMKIIETAFKNLMSDKEIKEYVFDELNKYNDTFDNSEVQIKHTNRASYDYSNDEIWLRLNSDKKSIDNKLKDREKYLKSLNQNNHGFDVETGEVVYPPIKKHTDILSIKIK